MDRRRTPGMLLRLGLLVGIAAGCAGCEPPLSTRGERSPFDRYDAIRDQHAEPYVEDELGQRRPNLRARLAPRQ